RGGRGAPAGCLRDGRAAGRRDPASPPRGDGAARGGAGLGDLRSPWWEVRPDLELARVRLRTVLVFPAGAVREGPGAARAERVPVLHARPDDPPRRRRARLLRRRG